MSKGVITCVYVKSGATVRLDNYTVSRVQGEGLHACEPLSHADPAAHCPYSDSCGSEVYVANHGSINTVSCTSSRNGLTPA